MAKEMPKKMTRKEEVRYLEKLIVEASHAYYNTDTPILSDAEFDRKRQRLQKIAPLSPVLHEIGAKAGTPAYERDEKDKMGSLENITSLDKLNQWLTKHKAKHILVTPKLDGLSMELVYKDREFIGAYTRGDGKSGTDVTQMVLMMGDIPHFIEFSGLWNVRGECVMTYDDFAKLNEELEENGQEVYKLPRSAAAGILLHGSKTKHLGLTFFAWELNKGKDTIMLKNTTERQRLNVVKDGLRINIVPKLLISTKKDIETNLQISAEELAHLDTWRRKLPYPTDGVVISLNRIHKLMEAGWSSTCPKGKVAFKFPPERKQTVVRSITPQAGRTGKITPVIGFDPVMLGGSEVEKASGHNYNDLIRNRICIGAKVKVEKACEIIPQVAETIETPENITLIPPTQCPSCNSPLEQIGENLFCVNVQCSAKLPLRIVNWLKTLNILGLGLKGAIQICDTEVKSLADMYTKEQNWYHAQLGVRGQRFYHALHARTAMTLAEFITAMGITDIGKETAKRIARSIPTIKELVSLDISTMLGMVVKGGMPNTLSTYDIMERLVKARDEMKRLSKHLTFRSMNHEGLLTGQVICITGTLATPRNNFARMIESQGGEFTNSLSAKCTLLVCGEGGGAKRQQAKDKGIKTCTEEEFMKMLEVQ